MEAQGRKHTTIQTRKLTRYKAIPVQGSMVSGMSACAEHRSQLGMVRESMGVQAVDAHLVFLLGDLLPELYFKF